MTNILFLLFILLAVVVAYVARVIDDYSEFNKIQVGDVIYVSAVKDVEHHRVIDVRSDDQMKVIVLDNGREYNKYDYSRGVISRYHYKTRN